MTIELKKFGVTLTSRDAGQEALAAFIPSLKNLPLNEILEIDFTGVIPLSPSWADVFLTGLEKLFPSQIKYLPSDNASVKATLKLLQEIKS